MELPSGCWSVALVLVLFLSTNGGYCNKAVSPQSDEDFAFEFTGDEDLIVEVTSNSIVTPIRKLWGMPNDLSASVGKIFRYIVPSDTFTTGVNYYELKNKNGKDLPNWIVFNKFDGSISGVPLYIDAQQVSLTLYGYRNVHDYASDEFKINVKYMDDYGSGIDCGRRNKTVLSIILNEAAKDIKPKQRLQSLQNLGQFWGLDSSAFRIAGQFKNEHTTIEENSIILAGPGDKKVSSKLHGAIQLVIGCDGKIDQQFLSILAKLKEQARDGTISEVTGLHVVGWRVAKELNTIRRRRDITTPEGGLDPTYYDENIDDDEDSDDLDEGSTEVPSPAIIPPVTEETPELEQSTHPHRHHHQLIPTFDDTEDQPPKITPIEETIDIVTTPVASTIKSTTVQSTPEVTSMRTSTTITADNDNTEDNDLTKQSSAVESNKRKPEPPLEEDDSYDDDDEDSFYDEEPTEVPTTQTTSTTAINVGANAFTQSSVINTEPTIPETTKIPIVPTTTPSTQPTTEEETITSQSTTPLYSTSILSSSNPTVQSTIPSTESSSISASTTLTPSSPSSPSTYSPSSLPTFAPTTNPEETTPAITTAAQTTEDESTIATVPRTVFDPPKNAPPIIKHRLRKIAWTAGKIHRYVIPNDTFGDPDGDTLILRLLDSNGAPIKDNSWIQFNDKSNEVYGLPLEKDVSKWHFTVQAEDSEGGIVSDELEVNVQHHKSKRTQTHEFTMKLRIEDKYDLPKPLDWQIRVLKGLMEVYKNEDLSHIRVRNVDIHSEPVTFSWSNISLPTDYCPKNDINALMNVLVSDNEGTPSLALQNSLAPEIRVKHVHVKGLEQCDGLLTSQRNVSKNTRPMPRNQIDHINATVGELLVFKVPADTFYDAEDGNTLKLKLSLLTMDRQTIPSSHWLQFDEKNKEFYGIPHASDKGRHEYQLICQDSGGLTATDGLVVSVNQQPSRLSNPSVHFSMKIRQPFDTFDKNPRLKRKFVEKLAEIFQDKDTSHIVIESITDSTVVTWLNRSLHTIVCPNDDISQLRQFLINNDESITDRVTKVMNSDFIVESVTVRPAGQCLGGSTPYHPDIPIAVPDDSRQSPSRSDDYLITIVLPAVIILTMLLLAGIVACVLIRRRRRSGKLNVGDEERRSLRTKGIPVIFQDELDDKPEPGNKTPIIMKEEKPPLPPPEYSKRGDSPEEEALYQPPPPFPANRDSGRSARPKATPTYRKPPPYVPP